MVTGLQARTDLVGHGILQCRFKKTTITAAVECSGGCLAKGTGTGDGCPFCKVYLRCFSIQGNEEKPLEALRF